MRRTNTAKWLENYNRWQIKVQKNGERRTFTCSTPGRTGQRLCNAKADAWLDDNITDTSVRIDLLFADYIDMLKETTSKSNWIKADAFGRNWILPAIGKRKVADLTEQHLQNIINKAYAKGLAKKTLTNLRATLLSFLKYCRKRKATTLLPENITIPKGARSAQKVILQPDHLAVLFSVSTTMKRGKRLPDPLIYAYRFQVLTGLRPGELLGLRWQDIRGSEVFVCRSLNAYHEITTGKNENAVRHFFLSPTASHILEQQRAQADGDRVFGEVDPQTYRRAWQRYCASNEIPQTTPYEMRHTFISIAKNLSEGQIRPLVGHSKNMDTFGVYGHELRGELQQTAQQIDNLFTEILAGQ